MSIAGSEQALCRRCPRDARDRRILIVDERSGVIEMSLGERGGEGESEWKLVYTKVHCETWSAANLRNQGFSVLLPWIWARAGFAPLFPRYLFVGHQPGRDTRSLRSTLGISYVVTLGEHPVRVPQAVIDEVRSRMDTQGVVQLDAQATRLRLFDRRERERVRALVKFAQAGFRVASA